MLAFGVDLDALGAWMDGEGLGTGPIGAAPIGGGTQNIVLRLSRSGTEYILRRPPLHKRASSDEAMRREARVLRALEGSGVPHPTLVGACGDTSILGAAFYLMEPVDGFNPTVGLPPPFVESPEWRHRLGLAMATGAAAIGAVDHLAAGLADLGRTEGYLERQVTRWRAQLEGYAALPGYPGPGTAVVDRIGAWLEDQRPDGFEPGLVHGDYHFANVLARSDRPELAAVVDWELTTIGDPLLDLGGLLSSWPGEEGPPPEVLGLRPWDGFPTPRELVAAYAEMTDRDLGPLPWYEVLACYKIGIILEGTYARACAGQADRLVGDRLRANARRLFSHAEACMAAA